MPRPACTWYAKALAAGIVGTFSPVDLIPENLERPECVVIPDVAPEPAPDIEADVIRAGVGILQDPDRVWGAYERVAVRRG